MSYRIRRNALASGSCENLSFRRGTQEASNHNASCKLHAELSHQISHTWCMARSPNALGGPSRQLPIAPISRQVVSCSSADALIPQLTAMNCESTELVELELKSKTHWRSSQSCESLGSSCGELSLAASWSSGECSSPAASGDSGAWSSCWQRCSVCPPGCFAVCSRRQLPCDKQQPNTACAVKASNVSMRLPNTILVQLFHNRSATFPRSTPLLYAHL